ncbi:MULTISPECIES: hypothetical protein [Paenibacillus]|uniref:hypothetical protein n=1 Tax=Paenibacillus TaxID=44249 RepID=UPI0003901DB1|nr:MULTISPECIES: hypothetical protein [Paenibacillus]CDN45990.1 hypothetical protein BN871_JW_00030 [Paenibacillus sp. P22]
MVTEVIVSNHLGDQWTYPAIEIPEKPGWILFCDSYRIVHAAPYKLEAGDYHTSFDEAERVAQTRAKDRRYGMELVLNKMRSITFLDFVIGGSRVSQLPEDVRILRGNFA